MRLRQWESAHSEGQNCIHAHTRAHKPDVRLNVLRLVEQVWQELSQGINGLEANGRTDVATARHGVVLQAKQKHTQRSLHDVEVTELYPAPCCGRVQSVAILLGMPLPSPPCAGCGQPLTLDTSQRYAIARLSGEVLSGHPCPACGERTLEFEEVERFTVEADGTLIVTPIANGIPRDSFAWDDAASGPDNAVFQRRGEGFPQTLLYTRVGDELQVVASSRVARFSCYF